MHSTEPASKAITVHFPEIDGAHPEQDAEWCEIDTPEGRRRLRFHDYAEIFSVPGLYEQLFYDELGCTSPATVRGLLADVLQERGTPADELVVLDIGAGNGMVGEELADLGARSIVGVDILEEAAVATKRDRPGVYDDYCVVDLTDPPAPDHEMLSSAGFNCLTSVAALGFGDLPPAAFSQAFDYIDDGGLIAISIKERFVQPRDDESGYSRLLRSLHDKGRLEILVEHGYRHRMSVAGAALNYVAYIGEKLPEAAA